MKAKDVVSFEDLIKLSKKYKFTDWDIREEPNLVTFYKGNVIATIKKNINMVTLSSEDLLSSIKSSHKLTESPSLSTRQIALSELYKSKKKINKFFETAFQKARNNIQEEETKKKFLATLRQKYPNISDEQISDVDWNYGKAYCTIGEATLTFNKEGQCNSIRVYNDLAQKVLDEIYDKFLK